jgi:hypothetical protein
MVPILTDDVIDVAEPTISHFLETPYLPSMLKQSEVELSLCMLDATRDDDILQDTWLVSFTDWLVR